MCNLEARALEVVKALDIDCRCKPRATQQADGTVRVYHRGDCQRRRVTRVKSQTPPDAFGSILVRTNSPAAEKPEPLRAPKPHRNRYGLAITR